MKLGIKLGIISDIHLEYSNWDFIPDNDTFYIIAGDIGGGYAMREWFLERFNDNVFWILGNHDYWGRLFPQEFDDVKTKYIPCEGLTNLKIAGATLWTNLSNWNDWIAFTNNMGDYERINLVGYDNYNNTHRIHRDYLLNSEADIIVSHHCPSYKSLVKRFAESDYNSSFCSNLDERILAMKKPPKLWIHGHTHTEHDYMIGNTRVICHPRGYPYEKAIYNNYQPKVIEI